MYAKNEKELGACFQNGKSCAHLGGYMTQEEMKELGFLAMPNFCQFGWECGRGECHRFVPSDNK